MEDFPSGWPPEEADATHRVVPVFPLPNVFLFPGCILPLHVFEPRYRQMVEDLLDSSGRLVIGTLPSDDDSSSSSEAKDEPPVFLPVAGLGEICRHERLDDGRFMIWVVGLARVRVNEVDSDRLYRRVEAELLVEAAPDGEDGEELRERLKTALGARGGEVESPRPLPIGFLTDLLIQRMDLPQELLGDLFAETAVAVRAESALSEHEARPLPPAEDEDES